MVRVVVGTDNHCVYVVLSKKLRWTLTARRCLDGWHSQTRPRCQTNRSRSTMCEVGVDSIEGKLFEIVIGEETLSDRAWVGTEHD